MSCKFFNTTFSFSALYFYRPEKVDFVRMAGLMDAIIVPFSAVGISDSVNILFDQNGTCHAYILIFLWLLRIVWFRVRRSTASCVNRPPSPLPSPDVSIWTHTDIRQIPFMRERTVGSGMPSARAGVVEDLLPPFFVPKAPERNYFLFGQVLDCATLHFTLWETLLCSFMLQWGKF